MDEDDRHTFSRVVEIYAADPTLSATIVGHLLVEAALADLVRTATPAIEPKPTFAGKLNQLEALGLISGDEAGALRTFNRIRNRYAHQLDYALDFDTAFALVGLLAQASFDFSDDTIHQDRTRSASWYGVEGCVTESVSSMFELIAWRTLDRGGADRLR